MERITVSLTNDQYQRLKEEAEATGKSKSEVLRGWLTTLHNTGEDSGEHVHNSGEDSGEDFTTVVNRLDDLEERVGDLEAGELISEDPDLAGVSTPTEPDRSGDEAELVDRLQVWLDDHPPHKDHGERAVVATFRYLRDHGTASTSEVQEAVYEVVADHYSDPRTMWNSISRYLEDVPGIEKAGYGEWAYAGDDQAGAELPANVT